MSRETKKFLDANGLTHFVGLLDNYPDNEILATVIDAISDELDNKIDRTDTTGYATQSVGGLMSPTDKQVLDNLNPNVAVTISNILADPLYIINAKQENMLNWVGVANPNIAAQTRTINMLDVNDIQGTAYINGSGVVTPSTGTDVMGAFIPVTPGQDIYYTGNLNPGIGTNQNFNRRLHVYDSNQNWIKQVNFTSIKGPNTAWSTHGTIPANGAYVRVSWNLGDYNIMVTVGAPPSYYPYYITPFNPLSSITMHVSPDGIAANGNTYTLNIPAAAGDVYACAFNPIEGKIQVTTGHIASYNGETLPGEWWSDRDVYTAGQTPSSGAEVIYALDSEDIVEYDVTAVTIPLFYHDNYFWIENGSILEISYYAETLAVRHLTIYDGATFGTTNIVESDIEAWNDTVTNAEILSETKADLVSPIFSGSPKAPTPGVSDNSTRIATTQYVTTKMNNIAPVEQSTKSSKNYITGQYLMNSGQLYKVISSIATGESFVIGSNIEATDVATELNLLFTQI